MLLMLRRDLQHVQEPIWQVGMKAYGFGFSHPLLYQVGGKVAAITTRAIAGLNGTGNDYAPPIENAQNGNAHAVNGLENGDGKLNALPYPLSGWTQNRDFPPFAASSFHEWWKARGDKKD